MQCWRKTLLLDWSARRSIEYTELKIYGGLHNLKFHVVVLQRTAQNCTEVRAARAARLFVLAPPIKFLICGVVVAVLVSVLKLPNFIKTTNLRFLSFILNTAAQIHKMESSFGRFGKNIEIVPFLHDVFIEVAVAAGNLKVPYDASGTVGDSEKRFSFFF